MAYRLLGARALSEPKLTYYRFDLFENQIKNPKFSLRKMHMQMSPVKWRPFQLSLSGWFNTQSGTFEMPCNVTLLLHHWGQPSEPTVVKMAPTRQLALIRFLPSCASSRPPICIKFATEKHGGMVHITLKWKTRTFPRFCTIDSEIFAARRR